MSLRQLVEQSPFHTSEKIISDNFTVQNAAVHDCLHAFYCTRIDAAHVVTVVKL